MTAVQGLAEASALDKKTSALAYLAVLAALRLDSGVPFHVTLAKHAGTSRDEVINAPCETCDDESGASSGQSIMNTPLSHIEGSTYDRRPQCVSVEVTARLEKRSLS
jgi:hypothetical protein